MTTEEMTAFGKYLAAMVRDNATPRTTDDELDAMVEEAITAYGDAGLDEFLTEAAKGCKNCSSCSDVPCGGCQQGGMCDRSTCRCEDHDYGDRDDEEDE